MNKTEKKGRLLIYLGYAFAICSIFLLISGSYFIAISQLLAGICAVYFGKQYVKNSKKMSVDNVSENEFAGKQFITDEAIINAIREPHYDPANLSIINVKEGALADYNMKTYRAEKVRVIYWSKGQNNDSAVSKDVFLRYDHDVKHTRFVRDMKQEQVYFGQPINIFVIDSGFERHIVNHKLEAPTVIEYKEEKFFKENEKKGFYITLADMSYKIIESFDYFTEDKDKVIRIDFWNDENIDAYFGQLEPLNIFDQLLPPPSTNT